MEQLKKTIELILKAGQKIAELFKRFILWVKKPLHAVIFTVCVVIGIVGIILFIKFLLGKVILIALGIFALYYLFKDTQIQLPNFDNPDISWTVTNFFLGVFESLYDILGKYCSNFDVIDDVYDKKSYLGSLYGAYTLRLSLLLTDPDITPENRNYLKNAIQRRTESRIANISGYYWSVQKNLAIPLLKIADIEKEGINLIISILLTNNETSVNAAYESDKPPPRPNADDSYDITLLNEGEFLLDEEAFQLGFIKGIGINFNNVCHAIFCGKSGSGKTTLCKIFLSTVAILKKELPPEIYIIDPKSDLDFSYLDGLDRFYRGENSINGLNKAFEILENRRNGIDTSRRLQLFFIDEVASMMLLLDKKEREEAQRKLLLLLQLSRSFKIFICLAMQQPAVSFFGSSAAREQAGLCCVLGNAGAETLEMLFDKESREVIKNSEHNSGRGVGWISINGGLAVPVRVPKITDFEKLNETIKNNLIERETNNE